MNRTTVSLIAGTAALAALTGFATLSSQQAGALHRQLGGCPGGAGGLR